jgi:hypothetical protein
VAGGIVTEVSPASVSPLHHFEIVQNGRGYWVAKDDDGLTGGIFRTRKDALRFALFEAAGDSARVHVLREDNSPTR